MKDGAVGTKSTYIHIVIIPYILSIFYMIVVARAVLQTALSLPKYMSRAFGQSKEDLRQRHVDHCILATTCWPRHFPNWHRVSPRDCSTPNATDLPTSHLPKPCVLSHHHLTCVHYRPVHYRVYIAYMKNRFKAQHFLDSSSNQAANFSREWCSFSKSLWTQVFLGNVQTLNYTRPLFY